MIKYYVMFVSNENLQLGQGNVTEWTDLDKAKSKFHSLCETLWAEKSVITGYVVIMDNQFDIVGDGINIYKEFIHHDEQPAQQTEDTGV